MSTDSLFHRDLYAGQMAEQLLNPGPLDESTRSGVFLSGIRRVGKTTFLRQDLIPALESRGALVIYVDLWADPAKSPSALVHEAVRQTLLQLQTPGSPMRSSSMSRLSPVAARWPRPSRPWWRRPKPTSC
jgi:hypothetical protein